MKHLQLFEEWHSGIEFGKRRDEVSDPKKLNKAQQDKMTALNKKEEKIFAKMKADKNATFKAKKRHMSKVESVDGKEALSLIDTAKKNVSRGGDTGGIIIYV